MISASCTKGMSQRVGWQARQHQKYMPDENIGLISMPPDAAGYISGKKYCNFRDGDNIISFLRQTRTAFIQMLAAKNTIRDYLLFVAKNKR